MPPLEVIDGLRLWGDIVVSYTGYDYSIIIGYITIINQLLIEVKFQLTMIDNQLI